MELQHLLKAGIEQHNLIVVGTHCFHHPNHKILAPTKLKDEGVKLEAKGTKLGDTIFFKSSFMRCKIRGRIFKCCKHKFKSVRSYGRCKP
jgi:hypothetical protein